MDKIKCMSGKPERKIIECANNKVIIQIPMTEEEHRRYGWAYSYPCNWWLILDFSSFLGKCKKEKV